LKHGKIKTVVSGYKVRNGNPAKQGLKLDFFGDFVSAGHVRNGNPAKQGLKRSVAELSW